MQKIIKIIFLLLLVANTGCGTEPEPGTQYEVNLQPGIIAVVSEGNSEPRSIGSYSLRIYIVFDSKFPYDNFVVGMIRHRDGVVESLETHDIDGDGTPEVIVVVRNAGTGAYLSADAYIYKEEILSLVVSVSDLASDANPIQSLVLAHDKASNK